MTEQSTISDKLQSLQNNYVQELPSILSNIKDTWSALKHDASDPVKIEALFRLTHNLAGSAGAFGFQEISDKAKEVTEPLRNALGENSSPTATLQLREVGELIQELRSICRKHLHSSTTHISIPKRSSTILKKTIKNEPKNKLIYLVEDDQFQGKQIALQIEKFAYNVRIFEKLSPFLEALEKQLPSAILVDIGIPEGNTGEILSHMHLGLDARTPLIFISNRTDFKARLSAVRGGGRGYFEKPLDINNLLSFIETENTKDLNENYRVMIIDDDKSQAEYHSLILQNEGLETSILTNPEQVLEAMAEFDPEILVLDMYMPGCNGDEIAMVVRQMDKFISIPIIFLSSENQVERQLLAMEKGGDDFLMKPVSPELLLSSVKVRAKRARLLRTHMVKDSLTGLLNHAVAMERFNDAISLRQRNPSPICVAMLDLDFFKKINDNYGHSTGDRVLKSFAGLLKQRLRATDIIGRYGGEEFVIVFPDTSTENSINILNELRRNFEELNFHGEETTFNATFSCGVADMLQFKTAEAMMEAADKALYQAKENGRNNVVKAKS